MIIADYSQLSLSSILAFKSDMKNKSENDVKDLIRHVILSTLKSYKKKYQKTHGNLVIACDGQNYWRKEVFQYYKAGRKKAREASDLNWDLIFSMMNEMREDLKKFFPYKVLDIEKAEADDVIAVLTEMTQEFGMHEDVMIISSDGDFMQLQKYDNVRQFNPVMKKLMTCKNPAAYLMEHIVKAGDDGIPNILSPDDTFVTGTRQKSMSSKRLEEFVKSGYAACKTQEERTNFARNKMLIDFTMIPEYIKESILTEYEKKPAGDKNSVLNYLIKHRCRMLLNEVEEF
jgi:hypothetical protein